MMILIITTLYSIIIIYKFLCTVAPIHTINMTQRREMKIIKLTGGSVMEARMSTWKVTKRDRSPQKRQMTLSLMSPL